MFSYEYHPEAGSALCCDVTLALQVGEACFRFVRRCEEFSCGKFSPADPNLGKSHWEVAVVIGTRTALIGKGRQHGTGKTWRF